MERVAGLAAKVLLREGTVRAIAELDPAFRRVELEVAGAQFAPGQKVQFRVRGLEFRTYTPFAWTEASASFLIVRHGTGGPAAAWADALQIGETVQLFGPRRALDLSQRKAPAIFVGDETSFATTAAWSTAGGRVAAQVYEVGELAASAAVLDRLGLDGAVLVERTAGDAHRELLARRAVEAARAHAGSALVLTGNVHSIRAVRDALKAERLAGAVEAKAHWDPRRKGLD
jgi:NADPH-dependent ferric siderophore reductase